jgi:hypothetical protein
MQVGGDPVTCGDLKQPEDLVLSRAGHVLEAEPDAEGPVRDCAPGELDDTLDLFWSRRDCTRLLVGRGEPHRPAECAMTHVRSVVQQRTFGLHLGVGGADVNRAAVQPEDRRDPVRDLVEGAGHPGSRDLREGVDEPGRDHHARRIDDSWGVQPVRGHGDDPSVADPDVRDTVEPGLGVDHSPPANDQVVWTCRLRQQGAVEKRGEEAEG